MEWRRHYEELFRHDEWNIGVVGAPIHAFLDPGFVPRVRWFPPPEPNTYRADPFAWPSGAGGRLLYERYEGRTGFGHVAVANYDGTELGPAAGMPLNLHLSFPFTFEAEGEVYCVPESCAAGEVALYRAAAGGSWERLATLLEGVPGVDSSVFRHGGRWWLLGTRLDRDSEAGLWAWHAERLTGPWRGHAGNPVKRDAAGARPAGTPFEYGGALYRPAQDCSASYGGAVIIQQVVELTPERFRETAVARWAPRPEWKWNRGWHTLAAMGNETLIDARRVTFMPAEFGRVLRRKLGRG